MRNCIECKIVFTVHLLYCFHCFSRFLSEVAQHSDVNKMSCANLATVFGPNLLKSLVRKYHYILTCTKLTTACTCGLNN